MASICVVVDNQSLQPLIQITEHAVGRLPLTTIEKGQDQAHIEIYRTEGKKRERLYTLEIDSLTQEKPEIDVSGAYNAGTLHLEFFLNGNKIHDKTMQLSVGRKKAALWPLIPIGMAAAALLLLLFSIPGKTLDSESAAQVPSSEQRQEKPAAAVPAAAEVSEVSEEAVITVKEIVYFRPNQASLLPETKVVLDDLAEDLIAGTAWL
ncbi:MAG: hypothetical protein HN368_09165, partial [Spirochaetales bacterium]|nr:hypothetical protein [Spirochaetales bacterium]